MITTINRVPKSIKTTFTYIDSTDHNSANLFMIRTQYSGTSQGPGRKGIPPTREIISGPISYFLIYFYIGFKRISVYGKNQAGPVKSLGAKFHCISKWANSANFQPIKTRKKFFSDYSQSQLAFPPFLYVNRAFNIARVREKLSSNSRIKTMLENLPLSMTGILSMLELYNL